MSELGEPVARLHEESEMAQRCPLARQEMRAIQCDAGSIDGHLELRVFQSGRKVASVGTGQQNAGHVWKVRGQAGNAERMIAG